MSKLLITTIPWFDEGEYDAVDPTELINVLTLFDDADWLVIGTDRYILDLHHEQAYQAKVAGARQVGQIIVESWGMSIYETIHGWSDDKLINWLESHGYTWDTDLMGWVVHLPL